MRYIRSVINISLGGAVGILGNLIAAWIQQDAWANFFTPTRLFATVIGFMLVIVLLAWLDASVTQGQSGLGSIPSGISGNVQIGNPVIRVLTGNNVYGNWQIGSGKIEVVDRHNQINQDER